MCGDAEHEPGKRLVANDLFTWFVGIRMVPAHYRVRAVQAGKARAVKISSEFDGAKSASWARSEVEHIGAPNKLWSGKRFVRLYAGSRREGHSIP